MIIDQDPAFARTLRPVLGSADEFSVEELRSLQEASALLEHRQPDVVLIGPSIPPDDVLEFSGRESRSHSGTSIVYVTTAANTEFFRRAMQAGLADVVPAQETYEVVAAAVRTGLSASAIRRESIGASERLPVHDDGRGKVLTVFSTKGGVGKTVIASNLGVALAADTSARVVLIDLDLQFGDTGVMLDLAPERTILDAARSHDRLDADLLKGFLVPHASGLRVLLAPVRPEDAEAITVSRLGTIIDLMRDVADYVVVDTAAAFDDVVLAAIDHSDEVFAVATMDVASIKNTRVSLQKLRQMGYDDRMVKIIVNRADSKVWLEPAEVDSSLEGEVIARIPSDRAVPRSVNRGVPIVTDVPKSGVAKSLIALAKRVSNGRGKVASDVAE
jgi:pilus assembly protein CpaE